MAEEQEDGFTIPTIVFILNEFKIVGELQEEMMEDIMKMIKEKLPHIKNWKDGKPLQGIEDKFKFSLSAKMLISEIVSEFERGLEFIEHQGLKKEEELKKQGLEMNPDKALGYFDIYQKDLILMSTLFALEDNQHDFFFVKKDHVKQANELLMEIKYYCFERCNKSGLLDERLTCLGEM